MPTHAPAATSTSPPRDPASVLAASTFSAGMRLLPADLQSDTRQLYHLLRTIDDLVDEGNTQAQRRVQAIEHWTNHQDTDTPETRILNHLSRRHQLPTKALLEFCEGMRHDLAHNTIEDETDLERYCQQVGGSIGIILAYLFGTKHPAAEHKMAALGRAFQRTNILRDIDEDREHGRLYIARTTIQRYGPPTPGARKALLQNQIARADRLYDEGLGAIPMLMRGQRGMALATALYREILRQLERTGYGQTPGRVQVPRWRVHLIGAQHRLTLYREA